MDMASMDCDATALRRAAFVPSASHRPLAVTIPFLDWLSAAVVPVAKIVRRS